MKDQLIVKGPCQLNGEVVISGSKNATLPLLAACLMADSTLTLSNIPQLNDVRTMLNIIKDMGASCDLNKNEATIDCSTITNFKASYELVKTMRASVLVLGPLLAKFGEAHVSFPGGCAIGSRPVDLHLKGMEALGAIIEIDDGYIHAHTKGRLKGARIVLDTVTVGGTQNILMAAVLAEGQTLLENAAREPEVVDLANFLNAMGADISGAGTANIVINGVEGLKAANYSVMADRIEAGTFLAAAAATRGNVKIKHVPTDILDAVIQKLEQAGAEIIFGDQSIELNMHGKRAKAVDIETAPYPGFPTDMQAQFTALNALAEGNSIITETIFENRFMHIPEIIRMGADIKVKDHNAVIQGIPRLKSAPVHSTDLRAAASLIISALGAVGETEIDGLHHMDRGYENIVQKFTALGAKINRLSE
jgi:UDP-N-acetylglucosamine 1-carboxyvinyltransferase